METINIEIQKVKPTHIYQLCPNCGGRGTNGFEKRMCVSCLGKGVIAVPVEEAK